MAPAFSPRRSILPAICLAIAALTGCTSADNVATVAVSRLESGIREIRTSMTMNEARSFFVGATRIVSAADRGSQVAYMAPDGEVHLWFPGNPAIVRGRWSLEAAGGFVQILGRPVERVALCFDYGPATVNAWTGTADGKQCAAADSRARLTLERADGDVFGLARRMTVPFVLPAERTSIAALKAKVR